MIAPTRTAAPSEINPNINCPVASLIQPMANGPANPPTLPIEFANAIPPAAAVPVRNVGGIVQNIGIAEYSPILDKDNNMIVSTGLELTNALAINADPPNTKQRVKCHWRSFIRSELMPIKIIPIAAQIKGMAAINPIWRVVRYENVFIICGSHMLTP